MSRRKLINWLGSMSQKHIEDIAVAQDCSWEKACLLSYCDWMIVAGNAESKGNTVVVFQIPKKNERQILKAIDELIEKMKAGSTEMPH